MHPISDDHVRYPLRAGREGGNTEGRRPGEGGMVEKAMTAETMLAAMDGAGVDRAVFVQSAALYGFDNSYIADAAREHRDRCIALCAVDVLAPDAADLFVRWVEERGCRGIRITQADSLDDPATFVVWET